MAKEKKPMATFTSAEIERVKDFAPVNELEKRAACGFYVERTLPAEVCVPLYRLCAESKDGESPDDQLSPWMPMYDLSTMIQGCIYLFPAITAHIKKFQANAPIPEEK